MSSPPPSTRRHPNPPASETLPSVQQPSLSSSSLLADPSADRKEIFPSSTPNVGASSSSRKRKAAGQDAVGEPSTIQTESFGDPGGTTEEPADSAEPVPSPIAKKSRTNTPWTPAEERRLKTMRDAGNSWSEIAKVLHASVDAGVCVRMTDLAHKTFPARTEGSVKKHWYKDMHYADFAEDESAALLAAIKEYEASKWKAIGAKVGKPAKACEQYAKEHFGGRI